MLAMFPGAKANCLQVTGQFSILPPESKLGSTNFGLDVLQYTKGTLRARHVNINVPTKVTEAILSNFLLLRNTILVQGIGLY